MLQHSLTDADREMLADHITDRAKFAPGDKVTLEPKDDSISYAGDECEGMPLTVEKVDWGDLRYAGEYEKSENPQNVVTLEDDTEVYVGKVRYYFHEPVHSLGEYGLIPWSEYRANHDRIILPPSEDNPRTDYSTVWLEPSDDPCEVCGCNLIRHSHYDNGAVTAGRETCPACGDVKAERAP